MKKYLLSGLCFCFGMFLLSSCEKMEMGTKNVTFNETVNTGETYSLDLSRFGGHESRAVITTQAVHYTKSQIDRDPLTTNCVYHYSIDTKQQEKETVVIDVSKEGGHCNHDSKTVVTVNLTVVQ